MSARRRPDLGGELLATGTELLELGEELVEGAEPPVPRRSSTRPAPNRLPPSLRRSANRPAGPRTRRPSARLMAAARGGLLTDANTRKGTAGRRAVDRVVYERRLARGRRRAPTTTARAAAGHGGPPPPGSITAMFRDAGFSRVQNPTLAERRRLNRWNSLVAHMLEGHIQEPTFKSRVRSWRPFRGDRFEWDPEVIKSAWTERTEAGEPLYEYLGRRT